MALNNSFPNAKPAENRAQQVVGHHLTGYGTNMSEGVAQVYGYEFAA
jgi:hypothetical protein